MKKLFVFALFLSLAPIAKADVAVKCVDGSRSFVISQNRSGALRGVYQNFDGGPEKGYDCRLIQTEVYQCTKGDYIVTLRPAAQGGNVVDFELSGDFFPDSGYLYQLRCQ